MAIKKSSQTAQKPEVTPEQSDLLARQLADKPYGKSRRGPKKVLEGEITRTTISLPISLFEEIEDLAMKHKRQKKGPKNVSAIVREALTIYLNR